MPKLLEVKSLIPVKISVPLTTKSAVDIIVTIPYMADTQNTKTASAIMIGTNITVQVLAMNYPAIPHRATASRILPKQQIMMHTMRAATPKQIPPNTA